MRLKKAKAKATTKTKAKATKSKTSKKERGKPHFFTYKGRDLKTMGLPEKKI